MAERIVWAKRVESRRKFFSCSSVPFTIRLLLLFILPKTYKNWWGICEREREQFFIKKVGAVLIILNDKLNNLWRLTRLTGWFLSFLFLYRIILSIFNFKFISANCNFNLHSICVIPDLLYFYIKHREVLWTWMSGPIFDFRFIRWSMIDEKAKYWHKWTSTSKPILANYSNIFFTKGQVHFQISHLFLKSTSDLKKTDRRQHGTLFLKYVL